MSKIWIYDTTLRDGAQGEGISFSVEDKLKVAQRLDEAGIDYIEGGWPGSNPKDVEFFQKVRSLPMAHAKIVAFGSTRRGNVRAEDDSNLQALIESGTPVVAVFGKSWDLHVTDALRVTLEENVEMIYDSIQLLKKHGKEVIFDAEHFFDGFKADPGYALKTLKAAAAAGSDCIVLCDTNGGCVPSDIVIATDAARGEVDVPLGIHAHNDSEMAVANSIAAVERGAVHVQGTINGYGERCGNANLCSVIPILQLKLGKSCVPPESLVELTSLSSFVDEIGNVVPNDRQPFVGRSAFAHKAGVHVDAMMKQPMTYEHIRPEEVGNTRRVLISELAGASSIVHKAQRYGVDLTKKSPETREVLQRITELENRGFSFEGAEASFELLLRKSVGSYRKLFDLKSFRVIVEQRGTDPEPITEATLRVAANGEEMLTVAEGDGPVHALDNALRKALENFYPELKHIKLTDFKVRVLNPKEGTAAGVRAIVESTDGTSLWSTVGVSTNIIEASWRALVDSVEYGLLKLTEKKGT
ncbi:MAG TPA: citramalate synthase [Armatimonadota bacterium]|nr:citramalate synthase [Armatimonadota bacterium]